MTYGEAVKSLRDGIVLMTEKFCPMINEQCKISCVCFVLPQLENILNVGSHDNPLTGDEPKGYYVVDGFCSNYSITGVK